MTKMIEQIIAELSKDLEFPSAPVKDKQGRFPLVLNPQLTVYVKELDPGYLYESIIGPLPQEKKEELFIQLMRANFLGQGTGGGVISLDNEEKFLTLTFSLPYDVNYRGFKETLEEFSNFVDYWREELERHKKESAENFYR